MKKTAVLLLTFLLCVYAIAQEDDFVYTITVIGNKGNTQSGIKVWMNNKATGKTIVKRTGSDGIVRFGLGEGTWTVNLPGLPNYREIDIKEGRKGQGSVMFSYDYDEIMKEQKIINDRKNIQFTTVDQGKMNITGPTQGNCVIKVHLTDASEEPVKGLNVDLISTKQAKIYHSETDQSGNATFLVPIGEIYAVDVENIRNFTFTGNVFRPGVLTIDDTFEPSVFKEINRNDTIVQMLAADEEASTSHVHVLMYVVDESLQPLAGETVYMQQLTTNVVYKGTSDENGQVVFMLPKGEKYMLHFDYQKDVDVYNYTKVVGRGNTEATVIYNPDPRLKYPENFIPKPDELFIEEFENFITKALPEPENDKKVDVFFEWGNAGVNASSKEAVLNIGVSGSNDERKFENVPYVDIAFVIDKSGSMYGHDRIEALKETMVEFTGKLRPDDYVCLVTFDTDAYIDIQLGRRGTGSELKRIISEIEPGGGTNIYNGMVLGYEQLLKSRNTDRAKQLILLTDGYGETEPAIVVEKSKEYNDKGLNISAIGVGEDYNYALLSLLTQNQGGLLSHAGESKDIYKAFETQLSGLLYPIAKDAKLEIVFNKKIKFNRLFGPDYNTSPDNRIIVELGTLYMGYNKTAIALFDLFQPDQSIEKEPVLLRLTYTDLETEKTEKTEKKALLTWEPASGKTELILEQEQKKLYTVAILNQSIKKMVDAFAMEDLPVAKQTLERAFEQLNELYPEVNDEDIQKLTGTMTNYAKAIDNAIRKKQIEENK